MSVTNLLPVVIPATSISFDHEELAQTAVDNLVNHIVYEGKPVTVWQTVAKLGACDPEAVCSTIDSKTGDGTLAKFKVGFLHYYASPMVALAGNGPSVKTVLVDMLQGIYLYFHYKVANRVRRTY